jgi:transcriptional regulator of acetoin/glycerol metabolism
MENYQWPGNVRQLSNMIERAKILADDQVVRLYDLPNELLAAAPAQAAPPKAESPDDLSLIERSKIVEVMTREGGNKARAARALGVDRRTLYRLLDRHGIRLSEANRS